MPEPMSNRPDAAAELADMRRKMIQQLTASGKLLQAVWTIDTDYFGSRFQHQLQQGAQVAFKEWDVATTVVETLAEELQGAAAFADSPVLRDCIASLVAGLEQLRTQVMELEKASLASVGLPSAKVQFNARVFPDNNPLACINEATGFVREVQGWITRTVDRIGALKMMLQEAERARQEAEETVTQVSTDEIAQTLGAEIKARDEDLSKLRAQAAQLQDKLARGGATAAAIEGGNDEEIRFLRAELARLADLNQSDRAEVRSLVVEIEGIAAQAEAEARPDGKDQTDDLVITLSVLRDAIADKGTIEAMATAADAVLVEWSKVVHRRAVLVSGELEQTKSFVSKHESAVKGANAEMEQLKLKLSAATGDAERSQAAFAKLQIELTQAKRGDSERIKAQDGDRQALAKQVAEVEARLADAGKALDAERGKLKIIGGERDNAARELAVAKADLLGARSDAQKARADAEQARTAVQQAKADADKAKAEAQARSVESQARQTAATEAQRKYEESEAAARKLTTELQQAKGGASDASARADAAARAQAEAARERQALTAQAADAKGALERAQAELAQARAAVLAARGDSDKAASAAEAAVAELARVKTDGERTRGELAQATQALAAARADLDKTKVAGDVATSNLAQANAELQRLKAEQTRLAAEAKKTGDDAARLTGELERARAAEKQQTSEAQRLGGELAKAKEAHAAAAAELAKAKESSATALARADAAEKARSELAKASEQLTRERDEARGQAQAKDAAAAKAGDELNRQLADARGKLAEAQAAHGALARERDEARTRLDELRKSTESLSSQSGQKQDSLARELDALRQAEAKYKAELAARSGEVAQAKSRVEALERELAQGRNDVATKARELAQAQQQATQQLQQARDASAKTDAELGQLKGQAARVETDLTKRTAEAQAATVRVAQLEGELKQARDERTAAQQKLAESGARAGDADGRLARLQARETELQAQLDSTRLIATTASGDRDKHRREVERLQGELSALVRNRDEQVQQLTLRLTETSRHLGELKQTHARLEADHARVSNERERIDAQAKAAAPGSAEQRRESTGVWTKRLSESAQTLEETRARAAAAERKLVEVRQHAAAAEERAVRAEQAASRVAPSAGGDAERRIADMKDLLRQARDSVLAAKKRQVDDQGALIALRQQIEKLGGKPKV